jgi:hypothetical protein
LDLVEYQLRRIDKELHEKKFFLRDLVFKNPLLFCAMGLMAGIVAEDKFGLPISVWGWVIALAVICSLFAFKIKGEKRVYVLQYARRRFSLHWEG